MYKNGCGIVTARGIYFRGNRFTCPRAIREQWFERAVLGKSWRVKVAYKHEIESVIYLVNDVEELEKCYLIGNSNNPSEIKLQRYFQSIQRLKTLREKFKANKNYKSRNKGELLRG